MNQHLKAVLFGSVVLLTSAIFAHVDSAVREPGSTSTSRQKRAGPGRGPPRHLRDAIRTAEVLHTA